MSVDKLVDSTQLNADLTSVANAIRTKGGTSAALAFPADFVSAIAAIPSGGGGLSVGTFSATPASTDATLSFDVGDYTLPSKLIMFFKSGLLAGDGVNIIMRCGFWTNQADIGMLNPPGSTNQARYFTWMANGSSNNYSGSYSASVLVQSGSTLNFKYNNNHKFMAGTKYEIQIYELDSTFFS